MKKHWKSHLTKNWLNEWAINGNFHFLSHRCKLIKIVKTNFVKGLKTCSKKSWSFGQPFIQPSGYVPYWHQWAPNYWFRHWWNIIGPTILFQLDIPFRPHNSQPFTYLLVWCGERRRSVLFRSHYRFIWSTKIQDFLMDSSRGYLLLDRRFCFNLSVKQLSISK